MSRPFRSLIRRILGWFGIDRPTLPLVRLPDAASAPPGTVVRNIQDGCEGVLTGWTSAAGTPAARIVFIGHQTSWVDVVTADRLDFA